MLWMFSCYYSCVVQILTLKVGFYSIASPVTMLQSVQNLTTVKQVGNNSIDDHLTFML